MIFFIISAFVEIASVLPIYANIMEYVYFLSYCLSPCPPRKGRLSTSAHALRTPMEHADTKSRGTLHKEVCLDGFFCYAIIWCSSRYR